MLANKESRAQAKPPSLSISNISPGTIRSAEKLRAQRQQGGEANENITRFTGLQLREEGGANGEESHD